MRYCRRCNRETEKLFCSECGALTYPLPSKNVKPELEEGFEWKKASEQMEGMINDKNLKVNEKAARLESYIRSLSDFQIAETVDGNYDHMGALIIDAMLQSGINYETVVRPRVLSLLKQYPKAKTTSGFLELVEKVGINELIHWKDDEKPRRILSVARFLNEKGIETEAELHQWLQNPDNIKELKKLRGIGDKTADYFKILVGIQTNAVDRHLLAFLKAANVSVHNYKEAHQVINRAAALMHIDPIYFDHSIWKYMSTKKIKPCER